MDPVLLDKLQSSRVKLGEKHKLFNDFLRQAKKNPKLTEGILNKKDDTDFYMKKLRFDLILALQREDLLIDLFNSEEKMLTATISKKGRLTWIFTKEGSPFLDPEFLAKEFFPKLSYVSRLKFVNQLAKHVSDEKKCQQIFEAIRSGFGLKYASRLLLNCSPPFISKILATNRVKSVKAFLIPVIAEKHPQVVFDYMKTAWDVERKKSEYSNCGSAFTHVYGVILRKLAGQDLKQFLDFYESNREELSGLHIGSLSRQVVKKHLVRVLERPLVYWELVNKNDMLRLENGDLVKFLVPLMSKRFSDLNQSSYFNDECRRIYPYLTEDLPAEVFEQLIEKGYPGQDVVKERTDVISQAIASRFGPEARLFVAEHKLQDASVTGSDCYAWISMKPTAKSIPELKQLLFIESDATERQKLISALLKTCKINGDKTALLEVIKFLVQRYRNDQVDILGAIITELEQFPKLSKLGNEHWDAINALLQVCLLHPMKDRISWRLQPVLYRVFANLAERDLPLEAITEKIFEIGSRYLNFHEVKNSGMTAQRKFIEECGAYYCKKYGEDTDASDSDQLYVALQIGEAIKTWNKGHRKVKLSVAQFPALKKKFLGFAGADQNEDKLPPHVRHQILEIWKHDPGLMKDMSTIYESFIKVAPSEKVVLYFLLQNPATIVEHLDTVFKSIVERKTGEGFGKFLGALKERGYKDIYARLVEKSLSRLEDPLLSKEDVSRAFSILSRYQSSAWMVKYVKKYIPEDPKIDLERENVMQEVQRVEYGVRSLLYIDEPSAGLEIIKSFCVGDYLKYARNVLYSLCEHANVPRSLELLTTMLDSPVSLKKHVIRLFFTLTPEAEKRLSFLEDTWKKEDNVSIRHVLVQHTLELFQFEAEGAVMERARNFLLNTIIPSLTFKDKAALGEVVANSGEIISLISGKPQEEFLLSMFDKLLVPQENLPPIERLGDPIKLNLIRTIGENHSRVSDQVLLQLCHKYFFPANDLGLEDQFIEFFVRVLLLREEKTIAVLLPAVLKKLAEVVTLMVPSVELSSATAAKKKKGREVELRERFCVFFQRLCAESFERRERERKLVNLKNCDKYISLFKQIHQNDLLKKNPAVTFDESLWMQLAIIFHSNEDVEIGREICKALHEYIGKYGNDILIVIMKNLKHFQETVRESESEQSKIQLIEGLIDFKADAASASGDKAAGLPISTPARIMALDFLPAECPEDFDTYAFGRISNALLTPSSDVDGIYIHHWRNNIARNLDVYATGTVRPYGDIRLTKAWKEQYEKLGALKLPTLKSPFYR